MESKISVTKCGYKRSLKAAQRQEWRTVKTKMEFYVTYERFKGVLEVFQSSQNQWVMHLSLVIGRDTYSTEDFHGTFSPHWEKD